jgi:hypothetical protein
MTAHRAALAKLGLEGERQPSRAELAQRILRRGQEAQEARGRGAGSPATSARAEVAQQADQEARGVIEEMLADRREAQADRLAGARKALGFTEGE